MKDYTSKLAPLIKDYLEFRAAIGRSTDHAHHLLLFDKFCCVMYPELDHINKEVVRGWISDEIAKGRGSLENKAAAIRMLAKYVGNGSYILQTNAIPKKQQYTPYILTDEELAAFFHVVDNPCGNRDIFQRETASVLWRLLYTCGLRPREGRLIQCQDISFETGEILVTKAKRSKERIIVMSDDMLNLCKVYNVRRAAVAGSCEYFFINGDGSPLKQHQMFHLFRRCWAQANPNTPTHLLPHLRQYDLRHRYASAIL